MCDIFDKAVRRGKELGEILGARTASYQGAVRLFQHGSSMEFVQSIFPDLPREDLHKALEESRLPQ